MLQAEQLEILAKGFLAPMTSSLKLSVRRGMLDRSHQKHSSADDVKLKALGWVRNSIGLKIESDTYYRLLDIVGPAAEKHEVGFRRPI